jgi:hypothetical protein
MYYLIADDQCKSPLKFGHFWKKWQGVHLRRNFATLRSFFERDKQDLEI